ncbi:MAG: SDR family NAD(P)-dependent oxidoreductase [Sandaracinaceae bacterium]|nr:SDR family NAD(P)-dependent oxidoreductase [Sandaracinaceae bacterium]
MQSVAGEPLPFPDKATVLGPAKVIPRELAGVTANVIDVSVPERGAALLAGGLGAALLDPFRRRRHAEAELDALADRLLDEVCSPPSSSAIALRGPRRYEEVFEPCPLAALEGIPEALREEGVYLITGGLGGLGLTIAEHLARTCRAKLVLIGRSPFPPRDQWRAWIRQHGDADRIARRIARVLEIERGGSEVLVAAADVTNLEEMRSLVVRARGRFGAIHGVFHTAGVIDDDLIAQKTQSSVTDVLTPKIQGTMVLERLFANAPLELLVLFSSTSTITAPAGQVDYVAANAFLDAFAASRAGGPTRVVAIDWGLWRGVGMAEEAVRGSSAARAGEPAGEQPSHPLLEARVRDGRGGTVLTAKLSPERHWVLGGHRTRAGHPLLVGTAYLELARAALEAYGERGAFEIEDLFFLRPLAVDDGEEREVRVRLKPTERGYSFETRSAVETDGKRGFELHAQAHVVIRALDRPPPLDVAAIEARCPHREEDPAGIPTPQEAHLALDPRWRVLRAPRAAPARRSASSRSHRRSRTRRRSWPCTRAPRHRDRVGDGAHRGLPRGRAVGPRGLRARPRARSPRGAGGELGAEPPGNRDDGEFVYFDVTVASEAGEVLVEVERLSLRKMTGRSTSRGASARPARTSSSIRRAAGASRRPRSASSRRTSSAASPPRRAPRRCSARSPCRTRRASW